MLTSEPLSGETLTAKESTDLEFSGKLQVSSTGSVVSNLVNCAVSTPPPPPHSSFSMQPCNLPPFPLD